MKTKTSNQFTPTNSTTGQIINCKAAVLWEANSLKIEKIQVHPPKENEVRIQVKSCGLCGGDALILRNPPPNVQFPLILGHEVAGVVESVGESVKSVAPNDHVVVSMIPQCGKCELCKSGDQTNFCAGGTADGNVQKFTMPDGTTRLFTSDGKPLYKYLNVGGFAEYVVTTEDCVVKIGKDISMDKFCLFACGITTGYGSVTKVSKVKRGSTVAIWGLGAVGLGAALGAKDIGAKEIICIGRNSSKEELAKKFGCTTFINSNELNEPIDKVLQEKYGGIDAGIDCVGNVGIINSALASTKPWGVVVITGVTLTQLEFTPASLCSGRRITGSSYGGFRGKEAINFFVKRYKELTQPLDDLISTYIMLDEISKGFEQLGNGVTKVVVLVK